MDSLFFKIKNWFRTYQIVGFTLLCAIFLWFYVVTDNEFAHIQKVPLYIENKPADWILAEPIPEFVDVRFRGTGKGLIRLLYSDVHLELDLNHLTKPSKIRLNLDMIKKIPRGSSISPLRIEKPESVLVRLDRFVQKSVPIRPNVTLIPMDSYTIVGDVVTDPDSVLVSGPESLITEIKSIETETVEFRELIKKIKGKIGLTPPSMETITYAFNKVDFKADVQRIGEIEMTDVQVTVMHMPVDAQFIVIPSSLSLKLQGGVEVLKNISKKDISVTINYRSRYRYKGKRIPATIQVPRNISFTDVRPKFFELVVER